MSRNKGILKNTCLLLSKLCCYVDKLRILNIKYAISGITCQTTLKKKSPTMGDGSWNRLR